VLPLLEQIIGHLDRVDRVAGKDVVDRDVPVDHGRLQAFVIDLFERAAVDERGTARLMKYHWRWDPEYLRAFVDELHWGLLDGAGAHWSAAERAECIEVGLGLASNIDEDERVPKISAPRARLVEALVDAAERAIGRSVNDWTEIGGALNLPPRYCEAVGLTSERGATVTPAGSTLRRLRGVDRLRWLLALETTLATSHADPRCLDDDAVETLSRGVLFFDDEEPPVAFAAAKRWNALGALRYWEDESGAVSRFPPTPIGTEILAEFISDESTSFRTLARAFLDDEREQVLAPTPGATNDRAATATLRHARMVAHEVRNALLPMQHALEKVWVSPAMQTADLSEPRRRINEGFARLHRFVDDSLRLTPIEPEEARPFSIMKAIDEARRQCSPSPTGGILIEALPAAADPRCRGHQGRLALALLNLLRNAVQVAGPQVRINISVDARAPGTVRVIIGDDGPGIPDEQRSTLFENGVSHRPGGTGHGLSFVRRVVEDEMNGRVRLVAGPDTTGACFELELPTEDESQ
jgi:signal transduction histidine kinase